MPQLTFGKATILNRQSWHGLARRAGWLRFAKCGSGGGSPAQTARQIAARPRAARPRAAPRGRLMAAPASLLCLPLWQWAKMVLEVSAAATAAATAAAARGRAA
eukprot:scaffold69499_cov55-Phaeocystis_antarctica.AAC.2